MRIIDYEHVYQTIKKCDDINAFITEAESKTSFDNNANTFKVCILNGKNVMAAVS